MTPQPIPLRQRVAAELRAEMGFQRRSVSDLALALGIGYQAAKRRYDGATELQLNEVDAVAKWLGIDRAQLVVGTRPVGVAS